MTTAQLVSEIEAEEGFRALPYQDAGGVWTNGFGNTAGVGPHTAPVTEAQARTRLASNLAGVIAQLDHALPWWRSLNDVRQDVLADMAFNLGVTGLMAFRHMLGDVESGAYGLAAAQMLMSKWATQVGERAMRLSILMEKGARA
jgi:lysozyme